VPQTIWHVVRYRDRMDLVAILSHEAEAIEAAGLREKAEGQDA
jgi:hypothetical protein